jgi:hypothetical protein
LVTIQVVGIKEESTQKNLLLLAAVFPLAERPDLSQAAILPSGAVQFLIKSGVLPSKALNMAW